MNENYRNRVFSLFKKNESNHFTSHTQLDDVDKIINCEDAETLANKYSQIEYRYNQSDDHNQ